MGEIDEIDNPAGWLSPPAKQNSPPDGPMGSLAEEKAGMVNGRLRRAGHQSPFFAVQVRSQMVEEVGDFIRGVAGVLTQQGNHVPGKGRVLPGGHQTAGFGDCIGTQPILVDERRDVRHGPALGNGCLPVGRQTADFQQGVLIEAGPFTARPTALFDIEGIVGLGLVFSGRLWDDRGHRSI